MTILSFQSQVISGHVGHQAALLPLERLGFQVLAVPTVLYSHHPGHGNHAGDVVGVDLLSDLVAGLRAHGAIARVTAMHTGYLAGDAQGRLIHDLVREVKKTAPAIPFFCDPVLGDSEEGLYVPESLAEFVRESLAPAADFLFPNHFELEYLTGRSVTTLDDAVSAIESLRERGPGVVVATSLRMKDCFPEGMCTLAATDEKACLGAVPLLQNTPKGTGDLFTAVFIGRILKHDSLSHALSHALTVTHRILELSLHAGANELLIVEGQDHVVKPGNLITVSNVR